MYRIFILVALAANSFGNLYGQKTSFFFPDYKFYFKSDGTCNEKATRSIYDYQYLRFNIYDSCKLIEMSCYRSKDSTLKEKGMYCNTNEIITQNARVTDASFDKSRVVQKQFIVFRRTGVWKFYDKKGKVIKTKTYK
jgi:antitoxin component YwqK of YwqJK toxin-antitoxin module